VHDVAAGVDLQVDVRRTPAVPARIDRVKADAALGAGALVSAQVALRVGRRLLGARRAAAPAALRGALEAGVDASGVAVPDLDVGALDRLAGACVLDGEDELERQARPVLGDVAPGQAVVDPVRALGDLRAEDAGGGRLRRARGTAEAGDAQRGARPETPEDAQGLAAAESMIVAHVRSLARGSPEHRRGGWQSPAGRLGGS
jgi:hypothetical protein